MSAPVKFLAVVVAGWVTFRAAASALTAPVAATASAPGAPPAPPSPQVAAAAVTYVPLGADPATGAPVAMAAAPQVPPGYVPAAYAYPPPYGYAPPGYGPPPGYGAPPRGAMRPMPLYYPMPYPVAAAMPLPRQRPWSAAAASDSGASALTGDEGLPARPDIVAPPAPPSGGAPGVTALTPQSPARLDRLSLSTWSLLRQDRGGVLSSTPNSSPLAIGGQLGGSQAGSRLTYRFTPRLSASLRFSAPVPTSSRRNTGFNGEGALGIAWQPLAGLPIRVLAERRQRVGPLSDDRNAFALLAEGGIYGKALPLGFTLDGYGQSGIVALRQRDWFVDGGMVAERPLFGRYSAGLGMWGGAQKGLNRLDFGPRISARMTRNIRLSLDYRYRAFGNAEPGSGFAVALGSDF